MSKLLTFLPLVIPAALAQQTAWGQCGGQYWTGTTSCVSGYVCTYSNAWYSQCLPGTSTARPTSTSTRTSSSSSSTSRVSSSSTPTTTGTSTDKFWFSFGDSYTQTGFSATGVQPNRANALGNPAYPGNTACGSNPNWVDYLGFTYNTTFVKVYNYAVSGATIDNAIVAPFSTSIKCMDDQVVDSLNYQAPGKTYYGGWSSSNAIFSFWIGINDIGSSYQNGSGLNTSLLNRYFQLVQQLYDVGARHFLFLTVPPVYRTPLMLSQSSSTRDQEKTVINDYNTKLAAKAAAFVSSYPDATAQIYDTAPVINAILDSPSSY
ncbi:hypothetical protein FRC18_005404, partial [Serendipita sp. 400]